MTPAIEVRNLGKQYRHFAVQRQNTIKEMFLNWPRCFQRPEKFWSLRDVTFSVPHGCSLGIIGANGAGKSTLLKLLGGIGQPTEGSVLVRGQINALLDLGSSFHPDLTGRENVYVAGIISGLNRRAIQHRFDSIVGFAELASFIDAPLRTYSDGMKMRLAFSIASHTNPDVLLVDEVLAVGDAAFQQRCLQRIRNIKAQGATIVIVSHSLENVSDLCDEVILLQQGRLSRIGPPDVVIDHYLQGVAEQSHTLRTDCRNLTDNAESDEGSKNRFGNREVEIVGVRLSSPGTTRNNIRSGQPLCVEIDYLVHQTISTASFVVSIVNDEDQVIVDLPMRDCHITCGDPIKSGTVSLQIDRLDLGQGDYYVNVGVHSPDFKQDYDFHWKRLAFTVTGPPRGHGNAVPPHKWIISDSRTASLPASTIPSS